MKLLRNTQGMLSFGAVITIAVIFVVLMFMAYLLFTLKTMLLPGLPASGGDQANTTQDIYNQSVNSVANVTKGFDQAVNFMVLAVIILIVALAIGAFFAIKTGRGGGD
jgi:hypothetical protein